MLQLSVGLQLVLLLLLPLLPPGWGRSRRRWRRARGREGACAAGVRAEVYQSAVPELSSEGPRWIQVPSLELLAGLHGNPRCIGNPCARLLCWMRHT